METKDWSRLWQQFSEMEGTAWDAEFQRLESLWKLHFREQFLTTARERGWGQEEAELCATEGATDCFDIGDVERRNSPATAASENVLVWEQESV